MTDIGFFFVYVNYPTTKDGWVLQWSYIKTKQKL